MKQIGFLIFFLLSLSLFAQDEKKVAVLPVLDKNNKVEDAHKLLIRVTLIASLANTNGFIAIDRELIDAIIDEVKFQESGMVDDDDRAELGKLYGAKYLLKIEVERSNSNNVFIFASLLDIEHGNSIPGYTQKIISKSDDTSIDENCDILTKLLFNNQNNNNANSESNRRGSLFTCGTSTITDYDGNTYKTVLIGSQCWMKQNLATTHYADGTALVDGTNAGYIAGNYTTKYWFVYNDNITYKSTYGLLYTWVAAMNGAVSSNNSPSGVQGVCPTGWHMPSDAEWTYLTNYLGGSNVAGYKLKEAGTTHWNSPNTGATNESGFTALPGGYRNFLDTFGYVGSLGYWWSSTELNATYAWNRYLYYLNSYIYSSYYFKTNGFSVRCLRDY